ncbi:MAG: nucleotidyltransferase family protein [Burkholderiales bacterium]|nr:nucleotidyltransferase family protein [Burkholderiales bacterium]
MATRPTLIVPAAGQGSRFGGPQHKLAAEFEGRSVLGWTVLRAIESRLPVLVVTTEALLPLVDPLLDPRDVLVISQAEALRGMGATIAAGVVERSGAPGWLVLPADMPLVRPASILAVAAALDQHAVTYAQHRGRRGHPVGFAAELYSELIQLQGDEGARRVVARYPAHGVELDDRGVLVDVDTEADLQALRRSGPDAGA